MATKYIPPHARNKPNVAPTDAQVASLPPSAPEVLHTRKDITSHAPGKVYALKPTGQGGATLRASDTDPNRLAVVTAHSEAHPRWHSEKLIFVKSNIDLLPVEPEGGEDGFNPVETDPVPVFENLAKEGWVRKWQFAGWYKIDRVQYPRPHSEELMRMLKLKFEKVDADGKVFQAERKAAKWQGSLSRRWAVVKFVKDEEATKDRGVPALPNLDDKHNDIGAGTGSKTVNEMLQEMRIGRAKTTPSEDSGDERQSFRHVDRVRPLAAPNSNVTRSDQAEGKNIESRKEDRQQLLESPERRTRSGKRYGGGEVIVS